MDSLIFALSLIAIVSMAYSFAMRKPLADRVFHFCGCIFLLLNCVCLAYLAPGRHITGAVFGVVCFIWIVICVATSYAFYEFRRQLWAAKNLPALIGALAVAVLGVIACACLLQWVLT